MKTLRELIAEMRKAVDAEEDADFGPVRGALRRSPTAPTVAPAAAAPKAACPAGTVRHKSGCMALRGAKRF